MKTVFIAKAISVVIASSVLVLSLVPSGSAFKAPSDADQPTGSTACGYNPSSLTVFPFTQLKTNSKGSISGFEFRLVSADGNCSTQVYSSDRVASVTRLNEHLEGDEKAIILR
ncbi:MAG TPA: hypothetical protein VIS57_12295 [Xanthomonadales bacterium]